MKVDIIQKRPDAKTKKKVAAYCRVSTEHDDQEGSIENQIQTYEDLIRGNPRYEFAGVYSDFGISGFKEKRDGFQRMMADAREGKFEKILTKSISRFARNTQLFLQAIRELKGLGVEVFFELQNTSSLTPEGELMITIYAAFAQAESEGISSLAKMAYRRKYEGGDPVQYLERSFGYCKRENGYEIEPSEAKWVREIYRMAAGGYTCASIKRMLNGKGVRTVKGRKWDDSKILNIIQNVIYKGDYIMHMHYVNEERKLVPNRGEVDAWYVKDDHIPIVSARLWQSAQDALAKRRESLKEEQTQVMELTEENYPYKGRLFCAGCGHPLYPKVYNSGTRHCWICSGRRRFGKGFCNGINVPDAVLGCRGIKEDVYVMEKSREKGIPEYDLISGDSWRRIHQKKEPPRVETGEFPYEGLLRCGLCGSKLAKIASTKTGKVTWICGKYKRKGKSACPGVRIPDEEVQKWIPVKGEIYITRRKEKDGKGNYTYSSKAQGKGSGGGTEEAADGGILPGLV
ncbi:MAG: recombinase family protein [Lachnospiraceae bacterium]|nr:recombinase family protein [Lachnospiraceae bacterium]